MRSQSRIIFLGVSILWIAANIAWLGCAIVPLPSSHKSINSRKTADFKFVKKSEPTREEVIAKLGQPDAYLEDLHVACYQVNAVTRRALWIMFLIPSVDRYMDHYDLALIQFDQTDHVQRYGFVQQPRYQSYSVTAKKWLGIEEKPAPKPWDRK